MNTEAGPDDQTDKRYLQTATEGTYTRMDRQQKAITLKSASAADLTCITKSVSQADRQTDRQTDRQRDRETDRQHIHLPPRGIQLHRGHRTTDR